MLSQLTIHNFGLIDQLSLDLSRGLNILTGATGAGKSILIDALYCALGGRLKTSQIRDVHLPCRIEAVFDLKNSSLLNWPAIQDFLSGDKDEDPLLIIQRQYLPDGRNKIKVNGLTVTLGQLKGMGDRLIDFHGPHDHQLILSESYHLGIIDQLIDFGGLRKDYEQCYLHYKDLINQLKELQSLSSTRDRDMDLLKHQIKELEQVPLSLDAYESLCQDQVRCHNAGRLFEQATALLALFDNLDTGISETFTKAFGPLRTLNQVDENTASWQERLSLIQENIDQLKSEWRNYLESLSFEPSEAEEINRRYGIYEDIRRKYGPAIEDALKFYEGAKTKCGLLENLEHNDASLRDAINAAKVRLTECSDQLTRKRKKAAVKLKKTIEQELKDLGIEHVAFAVRIRKGDFQPRGMDEIAFYISPNAGEDLKPLADIVSSGEAARLMLALKKALTKVDQVPVLIFDEIDAQIGGRLGIITGTKLKELSQDRQVILITHLPQIASFADVHFKVTKQVIKGRTQVDVTRLDKKSQVRELAQMMAGDQETKISLTYAEDMLESAKNS